MNAVWNSYGQLCGCPEIFKKSCKFFCRELDIRVAEFVTVIWHADKKVIGTKVSGDVVIFLVKVSKIGSNFQKQIITAVLPVPVIE